MRKRLQKPLIGANDQRQSLGSRNLKTIELLETLAQRGRKDIKPRNLVTRSGDRVRGMHHSLRHKALQWETVDELGLIRALDASPQTQALVSQSVTFQIESNIETFEYTPDVSVMRNGEITIIECKPKHVAEQSEWRSKLSAISGYISSLGIDYLVLPNEVKPDQIVKRNIDLILSAGSLVQYPLGRRKEDQELIRSNCPKTFRRLNFINRNASRFRGSGSPLVVHRHEQNIKPSE